MFGQLGIVSIIACCTILETGESVDELRALYVQNRASFARLDAEVKWSSHVPDEYTEGLRRNLSYAENKLSEKANRLKLAELMKKRGMKEVPDPDDPDAFKKYVLEGRRKGLSVEAPVSRNYRYIFDGRRAEIWMPWENELRRTSARVRNLSSFTGGDYSRVHREQIGERWTCYEPYPFVKGSNPTAWTRGEIAIDTLLPFRLEFSGVTPHYNNYLATLWGQPGDVLSIGVVGDLQILAKPSANAKHFLLAAFDLSIRDRLAFPNWISEWEVGPIKFSDLNHDKAAALAQQVKQFQSHSSLPVFRDLALPLNLVYFDSIVEIENAGRYPMRIKHVEIGPVRTKHDLLTPPTELPFGWSRIGLLNVTAVRANDAVSNLEPIEFANGTSFLDLDTNVGHVVGQEVEEDIEGISEPSRIRWPLIVISVAAVAVIFSVLVFRMITRR